MNETDEPRWKVTMAKTDDDALEASVGAPNEEAACQRAYRMLKRDQPKENPAEWEILSVEPDPSEGDTSGD